MKLHVARNFYSVLLWLAPSCLMLIAACASLPAPVPDAAIPAPTVAAEEEAALTETDIMSNTATITDSALLPAAMWGVVWQWQNDEAVDASRYTIEFRPDGGVAVQADCNRGRGSYQVVGRAFLIEVLTLTRAACGPDSLDQRFLEQINSTDTYRLEGANLVLTLRVAPGMMTLTPATGNMADDTANEDAMSDETTANETTSASITGTLTGTVLYRQRVALPAGSVINVELQDVSRADAPAAVMASQTITTEGENVPIPFKLSYDPALIDPRFTYAVRAQILIDNKLRWTSVERIAVLTNGNPATDVSVLVMPVE